MHIGITYDLRSEYLADGYSKEETAELDEAETIEAVDQAIQALGHTTERIGSISSLVQKLAVGKRWDLVFNIAEGIFGVSREAQVPALLDAFRVPYTFSDPMVLSIALHKGMAKRIVRDLEIPTPKFKVVRSVEGLRIRSFDYPMFVKPVAEGSSKGIGHHSKVDNLEQLRISCAKLLSEFDQPVLVEQYLPGREFTVGIIGSGEHARVLGVMEITMRGQHHLEGYTYLNKINYKERVEYRLAADMEASLCSDLALKAWRGLECRDCGRVDLKMDAQGIPNFLEVNPLAGLNPHYSDLPILCNLKGITYQELIKMILESSLVRVTS
jgi:D-alanine-D-alanine ligase